MGYRYALHVKHLPGKPDIFFVSRRKIIFVHGCFWHNHGCRHGSVAPATNTHYWNQKRERNAKRDQEHAKSLRRQGGDVLVIWECQTRSPKPLRKKLATFLG